MNERPPSDDPIGIVLRRAFAGERPPDSLVRWLARSLRALPSPAHVSTRLWRGPVIALPAALSLIVLGIALWRPTTAELADVPLKELQSFIDSNRAVDVATDDPARIRAWLAQRVGFAPPPTAGGSGDIGLIGGRLCLFSGRRVASYMYRVHGRVLSIYIMSADRLSPSGLGRIERAGTTLALTREGRLNQASWKENGLIYSVVGELSEPALLTALDELRR